MTVEEAEHHLRNKLSVPADRRLPTGWLPRQRSVVPPLTGQGTAGLHLGVVASRDSSGHAKEEGPCRSSTRQHPTGARGGFRVQRLPPHLLHRRHRPRPRVTWQGVCQGGGEATYSANKL